MAKQFVTDVMSQSVIDFLEQIEIQREKCDRNGRRRIVAQQIGEFVLQQVAIDQSRQRIIMRHIGQLAFRLATVGNVFIGRNPATGVERLVRDQKCSSIVVLQHKRDTTALLRYLALVIIDMQKCLEIFPLACTDFNIVYHFPGQKILSRDAE